MAESLEKKDPDIGSSSINDIKKTEEVCDTKDTESNEGNHCENNQLNPECSGSSNNHVNKEPVRFTISNKDKIRKRAYRRRLSESSSELDSDDDTEKDTKKNRENNEEMSVDLDNKPQTPAKTPNSSENTEASENPTRASGEPPPTRPRRPPLPSGRSVLSRLLALGTDSEGDDDDNADEDVELDDDDVAEFMDDSSDENEGPTENNAERDAIVKKEFEKIQKKSVPKNSWNFVPEFVRSQTGRSCKYQSSVLYAQRYYDSLHVPTHLKLTYQLEYHRGCVNALNFNSTGSILASGSDDLKIAIWDWARRKTVITYSSGHKNNVFHSKFLPLSGDRHVVSCARDGEVRLAELSSMGVCKSTRLLAKHGGPAHKLAIRNSSPHEVLSVGEDSFIFSIDIREPKHKKLAVVKDTKGSKVALYSIHAHPINDNQYCISGRDQYVRVYDRRITGIYAPAVIKYCPSELVEKKPKANVTSVVYSNNGDAILASYNDDDIYLFDTSLGEGAEYTHRYGGHRNSATVKGVNFFSPNSNYIISGSDCGNIFFWHRETEAIVQCLHADNNGVVNVLEPHPNIPMLATSGLDNEVKVWMPICEEEPDLSNLEKIIMCNLRKRHRNHRDENFEINAEMLTTLYRNVMRRERSERRSTRARRSRMEDAELPDLEDSDSSSTDNSTNTSDDELHPARFVQCAYQ